ncbi:MAG: RNA polymerase sigma factor [Acidimicrobiia bacterium]
MIKSEEEDTFVRLFEAHHRAVLAYFLRRLPRDDAYDATADVFVVAWRRKDDVPVGSESLPWLYGVSRRVLANQLRSHRRSDRLFSKLTRLRSTQPDLPETIVIQQVEDRAMVGALATLRPQDQEILRLAYWEELPHAAIGEIVGCSRKTADVRIHRALRRLRQAFEQAGHRPEERQIGGTASPKEQKSW